MRCENEQCIYNQNAECLLDEIGLDAIGMCDACIIVDWDKDLLEAAKIRQHHEINSEFKETLI